MIADFEDFCTQMYVTIDDIWQKVGKLFTQPGPQSECSDTGLITLAIISECKGWDKETEMCSEWRNYQHLFPHLPERSRFNRRRRRLMSAINVVRQKVLLELDVALDQQCVIDSLPVPIIHYLSPERGSVVPAKNGVAMEQLTATFPLRNRPFHFRLQIAFADEP